MVCLEFEKVSVALNGKKIIHDISLSTEKGEFVSLVGPNGAGKTTLIRAAAGLIPYEGSIRFNGQEARAIPPHKAGRMMAYIPQGHDVHWPMRVKDIVGLGRLPYLPVLAVENERDLRATNEALEVTSLKEFSDRRFDQLSGGEKSRVMIARALSTEADLLFADEPTAALDPYHQLHVLELLKSRTRRGMSVIAILHDIMLAAQFSDRIILLHEGKCVTQGKADQVLTTENMQNVYNIKAAQPIRIEEGLWTRISK